MFENLLGRCFFQLLHFVLVYALFCSGFLLILLIETVAGKCLGGRRRRSKKTKKKIGDDQKEEKRMPETPETVQMVERWVEVESLN